MVNSALYDLRVRGLIHSLGSHHGGGSNDPSRNHEIAQLLSRLGKSQMRLEIETLRFDKLYMSDHPQSPQPKH